MKAAILREYGRPLSVENIQLSKPLRGEVLVRMVATGLCHSDLHVMEGNLDYPRPIVLGHEAAGIVEQVGPDVSSVQPGDHVVVCITFNCGHCPTCHGGSPHRCRTPLAHRSEGAEPRFTSDGQPVSQFLDVGAFAEAIIVHESGTVPIDKDMPLDRACLLGCGVATGFGAVARTAGLKAGETIAVIGCGGVGLASINAAQALGAGRVVAIDRSLEKLELAAQLGASDLIDASEHDPVAQILELTNGQGVDHVIEAVGLEATIEQGFASLAAGGTLTVAGATHADGQIRLPTIPMLLQEKRVQGCYMGGLRPSLDIPRYVELYQHGRLKLDQFIGERISLSRINEGFDAMRAGQLGRSVILFE